MKISYSNYPVLKLLTQERINDFQCFEEDWLLWDFNPDLYKKTVENFNSNLPFFKKGTILISDAFNNSCLEHFEKLMDLYVHIIKEKIDDIKIQGTYIIDGKFYMVNIDSSNMTYNTNNLSASIFGLNKHGALLNFYITGNGNFTSDEGLNWFSKDYGFSSEVRDQMTKTVLAQIISLYMFERYAEVETKLYAAKSKSSNIKCLYNNQTDISIKRLDSKWFTNIVRSEGFKVNGHFRLQPFGEGKKVRKLIWINEFQKKGYHSTAKILKQNHE